MNTDLNEIYDTVFESFELNVKQEDIIIIQLSLTNLFEQMIMSLPITKMFQVHNKYSEFYYLIYSFSGYRVNQRKLMNQIINSGYFRKIASVNNVRKDVFETSLYGGACYIANGCYPSVRMVSNGDIQQLPKFLFNEFVEKYKILTHKEDIKETTKMLSEADHKRANKILDNFMKNEAWDDLFAELYSLLAKDRYFYDEINKDWYLINRYNIWNNVGNEGFVIMNDMREVMYPVVKEKFKWIDEEFEVMNSKEKGTMSKEELDKLESLEKKQKKYNAICKVLHSVTSKKNILTSLKGREVPKRIFEKFDNVNLDLFAFDNGVFDLQKRIFRLPLPSELVTTTCGYDYEDKSEIGHIIEDIHKIVSSITLNDQDKNSLLMEIAQCLSGNSVIEAFYIWKGAGGNGKGVLRDLIKRTFGPYYDALDILWLTKNTTKSSANDADDSIARKKNCRIVITTEPDSDTELKTDKLKQISGNDEIPCRTLYSKQFKYVAKFKLIIQTNFDVKLENTSSKSLIRRIQVDHFPFNFTDNPVLPNDRLADNMIKTRIRSKQYDIAFFHVLLDMYFKWIDSNKNFNYSENTKEQTNMLLLANDPITPFVDKYIIKTGVVGDTIRKSELYAKLKQIINGEMSVPTVQGFKSGMDSKGHPCKLLHGIEVFKGIKFNDEQFNKDLAEKEKGRRYSSIPDLD